MKYKYKKGDVLMGFVYPLGICVFKVRSKRYGEIMDSHGYFFSDNIQDTHRFGWYIMDNHAVLLEKS